MAAPLQIKAIALVSSLNHPIIVRSFSSQQDELKANYVAHTSLDIFDERLSVGSKFLDCYLGHLYSMEDLAVYGYVTPTRVKIILAIELVDALVRDADIITIFKAVHAAYHDSLCNPFLRLDVVAEPGPDPSPLLDSGSKQWKGLKKRIDNIGRTLGSLPAAST